MKTIRLSEEEAELIAAIRNFRNGFPNGKTELLYYAQQLFEQLTSLP